MKVKDVLTGDYLHIEGSSGWVYICLVRETKEDQIFPVCWLEECPDEFNENKSDRYFKGSDATKIQPATKEEKQKLLKFIEGAETM